MTIIHYTEFYHFWMLRLFWKQWCVFSLIRVGFWSEGPNRLLRWLVWSWWIQVFLLKQTMEIWENHHNHPFFEGKTYTASLRKMAVLLQLVFTTPKLQPLFFPSHFLVGHGAGLAREHRHRHSDGPAPGPSALRPSRGLLPRRQGGLGWRRPGAVKNGWFVCWCHWLK